MATQPDEIGVINGALARVGGIAISTLAQPGPAGQNLLGIYETTRDAILSKYAWRFTRQFCALDRDAIAPLRGWTYAYVFPPDMIGPPRAYYDSAAQSRPFNRFELHQNRILCNAAQLYAVGQKRVPLAYWAPHVKELIVMAVAAEYASAIRENWDLRKQLRRETYGAEELQGEGGQFAVCVNLDMGGEPSPVIDGGRNPLIAVRHRGVDARADFNDWDEGVEW